MIALLDTIFESLTDISTSQWFYLIIFSVALLDSVVPVVPSESMVIVGGVAAGLGDLEIPLVIVIAAAGAFLGDNLSYLIGRRASASIDRRYRRTEKGATDSIGRIVNLKNGVDHCSLLLALFRVAVPCSRSPVA